METPAENAPEVLPLDSIFRELRSLPLRPPRREMLEGLRWRAVLRMPTLVLLPLLLLFTLFPLAIFATIIESKSPKQRVSARVIQVERFGQKQIFVKYRFTAKGQNYTGAGVGFDTSPLQNLQRGAPLEISFEKTSPQNNAPSFETSAQEDFPWPFLFLFPLMGAFFFVPLFVPQLRATFLARKLFARGVLTTGKVRFVKVNPLQTPVLPGGTSQIFYQWDDQNGTTQRGTTQRGTTQRGTTKCDNVWLVQQFHPDSPVVVTYNPKKPAQNIILEPFVA